MKSRTRNKSIALLLNILSFAIMLGLPFWVITEKFPIWKTAGGLMPALGGGAIIMVIIAFFTFKKYIVAWATEKLGAISAGVSLFLLWSFLSAVCVALAKSATLLDDLTTVFILSAIGAGVGVIIQIIARGLNEKVTDHGED